MDVNRPKVYGTVADSVPPEYRNLTPRGSIREPYKDMLPVYDDFVVTEKWDLWADNVSTLYEEAKARQWNATKDIAWDELEQLPEDLEKAACQLATFLTEIEFMAGDFPAKWMYRIPAEFLEIKAFLATQIMDEARHLEVFRKRALAGGGGLLHNYLENHPAPDQAMALMHRYADIAEVLVSTSILQPVVLEPLAILMGGG